MMSDKEEEYFFWQSSFSELMSLSASVAIIFGGIIPYIPQYSEIKKTANAEGFSTYVCLTLLVANILRILFWFGRQFELPLLVQSVVMNLCMLILMELCVRVKHQNLIVPSKNRYFLDTGGSCLSHKRFIDFDLNYFWAWTDFVSYLECLAVFTVISGIIMYSFLDKPLFVESVGFVAVLTEALLGTPQLLKNYKNKSTLGMSKKMVILWTIGDLFKTGYFIIRSAPVQFWVCGVLQVSIDLLILTQVILYKSRTYDKLTKAYHN